MSRRQGQYRIDYTEDEYKAVLNMTDAELVQTYHEAYDLSYEEHCEAEMVRRFIARVGATEVKPIKRGLIHF